MGVEMSIQEVEHFLPMPFLPTPNLLLSMVASILDPSIIPTCIKNVAPTWGIPLVLDFLIIVSMSMPHSPIIPMCT